MYDGITKIYKYSPAKKIKSQTLRSYISTIFPTMDVHAYADHKDKRICYCLRFLIVSFPVGFCQKSLHGIALYENIMLDKM